MHRKAGNSRLWFGTIIAIIVLTLPLRSTAQESGQNKIKRLTLATVDFIDRLLNEVDTAYVTDNLYNMTFMPVYSYNYEHYSFKTTTAKENQGISIAPDSNNQLTFNIGWHWISVGYSIDLQDSRPQTDFNVNLYTARFGLDLFYRNSNEGYKIRKLTGFYDGDRPLTKYDNDFDGLTVEQHGANLYYAFNKRFSYSAAYGQSTIQRVSAGSFIIGASYNQQVFDFNYENLDQQIGKQLREELRFRNIRYQNFSISLGYSYNWAFARNFLASISLTPAVGYKNTSLKLINRKSLLSGINFDLTTRAALLYNNNRCFAGLSLVAHSYQYNKKRLTILNGFGVLKLYAGINFWRKK